MATVQGDLQEFLRREGPTPLEAFGDQVGGHYMLLKLGNAVCKPLVPREQFFYESIPREIRSFTPQYHGECPCGSARYVRHIFHLHEHTPFTVSMALHTDGYLPEFCSDHIPKATV